VPAAISRQASHLPHGVTGRCVDAVERLGKDPSRRRFASSARANEDVGVRESVLLDGIFQRAGDVLLTKNIVERLRPIFAGKNRVTHSANATGALIGAPLRKLICTRMRPRHEPSQLREANVGSQNDRHYWVDGIAGAG
jgi:hypothetical protein